MLVQPNYDENDRLRLYERMAESLNLKAFSYITIYMATVGAVPYTLDFFTVPSDSTLYVVNMTALAEVAGAGGANGLTVRFSGGSANLDINVLPVAATTTTVAASSFSNYQVPSSGTLTVTAQADDHAAAPTGIRLAIGVRLV